MEAKHRQPRTSTLLVTGRGARVWEPSREHGFHALRHFFASEELAAGESIVSPARWLGHSDPEFTLRKYSHFLPHAGARGSSAIDAIFAQPRPSAGPVRHGP
ncbi:hypothetical protein ABZ326_06095 [Streptomyces californicus]|uniref:hypothetical protein n=1 Tax=Streptomyces californicus TaxID=67351 RepID=UPI0034D96296